MAEISKIALPNGVEYDIKDTTYTAGDGIDITGDTISVDSNLYVTGDTLYVQYSEPLDAELDLALLSTQTINKWNTILENN